MVGNTDYHPLVPHSNMPRADANGQGKRWCFTLNNYTEQEHAGVLLVVCKYLICGREIGENGTPHLQGFVVFDSNKRLGAVRLLIPRAHWEIARGTTDQASDYCKKDGNFNERGVKPRSPKEQAEDQKAKWADFIRAAKAGTTEDEYPREHVQYNGYVGRTYQPNLEALDSYSGLWYFGQPGCGKSRKARADFPGCYSKGLNKWWDGFRQEEAVLLDDVGRGHLFLGEVFLKNWTDHYPFRAEVKNGSRMLRPRVIIVTSNYTIAELWAHDPTLVLALERRFKVINFDLGEQFPAPNFDIMQ